MKNQKNDLSHNTAVAAGHEPDTAPVRGAMLVIIGLSLLTVVAMVVVGGIMAILGGDTTFLLERPSQPPASPNFYQNQAETLLKLRKHEKEILTTYAWIDRESDIARIPIERAIQVVSQQGLPYWPEAGERSESEEQ